MALATAKRNDMHRTRYTEAESNKQKSRFDITVLQQKQETGGFASLSGAGGAVLSSLDPDALPESFDIFDQTGTELEEVQNEQLGLGKKISRFFSRSVNFDIGGTNVRGKNGFQVKGGSVKLGKGMVLDLSSAMLLGKREKALSSAEGGNAGLYIVADGANTLLRQSLSQVYLDSTQKIEGSGSEESIIETESGNIKLSEVKLTKGANQDNTHLEFRRVSIEKSNDLGIDAQVLNNTEMNDGKLLMPKISFDINEMRVSLTNLALEDKTIKFEKGEAQGQKGFALISGGDLNRTAILEQIRLRWTEKEATDGSSQPSSAASPTKKAYKAATLDETFPNTVGEIFSLHNVVRADARESKYIGSFSLNSSLLTKGEQGVDFGNISGEAKGKAFAIDNQGKLSAQLGSILLNLENKDLEPYAVELSNVSIEKDMLKINEIEVSASGKTQGIEVSSDATGGLNELIAFSLPALPKRSVFNNVVRGSNGLEASFCRMMKGVYKIENLGGMFSGEVDLEKNILDLQMTKEKNLTEQGFFSKDSITLAEIPILPGLTFEVSLSPSAKMSGSFGVHGESTDGFFSSAEKGKLSASGSGAFKLEVGLHMNADLNLGLGSLASAYAGLFAGLDAEAEASLSIGMDFQKENKKISADSLNLNGKIDAGLKGLIGGHAGFKVLVWDIKLLEYVFKEWQLANLSLSANISKDMTKSFTNGWLLEQSSFNASAFGKEFSKEHNADNRLRIASDQKSLIEAVRLIGDFEAVYGQLKALSKSYEKMKSLLSSSGTDTSLHINITEFKAQIEAFVQLQEKLGGFAEAALEQDKALELELNKLLDQVSERSTQNAPRLKKHRDRIIYLSNAQREMADTPQLSYEEALTRAKASTRERLEKQELLHLNIYDELLKHENIRLNYYTKKGQYYSAEIAKHQRRIATLNAIHDDPSLTYEEKQAKYLSDDFDGKTKEDLRAALDDAVTARLNDLDSLRAFKGSEEYRGFDSKTASERLEARMQYEKDRYSAIDSQTLNSKVVSVITRRERLTKIEERCRAIASILVTAEDLEPGSYKNSIPFNNLSVLLNQGADLDDSAEDYEYINEAESTRAEQRNFLLRALQLQNEG